MNHFFWILKVFSAFFSFVRFLKMNDKAFKK